jgi:hypothetical protein
LGFKQKVPRRFIATLPLQKRSMNLKKGPTNICGHLPPTREEEEKEKLYHSIAG